MPLSQFALDWIALESMGRPDHRRLLFTRPLAWRRNFHAFGVSMQRSGTHSMASIFANYRTIQEPVQHIARLLTLERANQSDTITRKSQIATLRFVDTCLFAEMSSGGRMGDLVDALVEAFPRAKFMMTIRNPYSWLQNVLEITRVKREEGPRFVPLAHLHFQPHRYPHPPQEAVLLQNNVWSLDSYLSYWAGHHQRIFDTVPAERLLALRLDELSSSSQRIADFLDIDPATLDMDRSHEHKTHARSSFLSEIDRDHLEARIDAHCRPLLDRFFPDIKSMDDALPG